MNTFDRSGKRVPAEVIEYLLIGLVLLMLALLSKYSYLLFHTLAELIPIAIGFSIFIIVWNTRQRITDPFFLMLGVSLLFVGGLDLLHTLAYKGMGVFGGDDAGLATELWIAARYFQSVTFLIATLLIGRSIHKSGYETAIISIGCAVGSSLLALSIFLGIFPACYIEGSGLTMFKVLSEYLISFLLIVAAGIVYHHRTSFDEPTWRYIILALIFLVLGELAFTSYVGVYGGMNLLGHLLRLVSVYFLYRAIVVVGITNPMDLLFREIRKRELSILSKNQDLIAANQALEDTKQRLDRYVTELMTNREELIQTKAYLEQLITHANAPIIVWNLKTEITVFNQAFANLTGISCKDAIGMQIQALFPESTRSDSLDLIRSTSEGGQWDAVEIPILHRSGEVKTVLWNSANIVDASGSVIATIAQGQDITDRKKAEKALKQVNRQLNLMTSVTRHDILNQINALNLLIGLMERKCSCSQTDEYFRHLEQIVEKIEYQIEFTRTYEKLGSQEPMWQDIRTILTGIQIPDTVRMQFPDESVELYADILLERVFYNLFDNSLRHGMTVSMIRVGYDITPSGVLTIRWEDDGVGISDNDKERIFDLGYGKNTGFGLFFIRDILSITGIEITETGNEGSGARFEIRAPPGEWRREQRLR